MMRSVIVMDIWCCYKVYDGKGVKCMHALLDYKIT